ncbi:hypothetical protein [Streptomyces sp. NPDC003006]
MTSHHDRQPDGAGTVPATKKDFEERVKALIKAAKDEQYKRIGPLEVEAARHKEALTGVNAEVNALKGEITLMAGSFKGLESNVRVYGKDVNLYEMMRNWRKNLDPADMRDDIDALKRQMAAIRTRAAATPPAQRANFGNTGTFSEAAAQINRLEARINSLVRSLG